jgi:hypothetical protein
MIVLIYRSENIYTIDGISLYSRTVYLEQVCINKGGIEYLEEYESIGLFELVRHLWKVVVEMIDKERGNEKSWGKDWAKNDRKIRIEPLSACTIGVKLFASDQIAIKKAAAEMSMTPTELVRNIVRRWVDKKIDRWPAALPYPPLENLDQPPGAGNKP